MLKQITLWFISSVALATFVISETCGADTVDLAKLPSSVEFLAIGHPGFLKIRGKGGKLQGQVDIKEGGGEASVQGELRVVLNDFDTGINKRNEHMRTKYLQTDKFPEAKLTLESAKFPTGKSTEVPWSGQFFLHGVTHEVSGQLKVDPDGHLGTRFSTSFTVNIKDYEIDVPSFMGVVVAQMVTVDVAGNWQK